MTNPTSIHMLLPGREKEWYLQSVNKAKVWGICLHTVQTTSIRVKGWLRIDCETKLLRILTGPLPTEFGFQLGRPSWSCLFGLEDHPKPAINEHVRPETASMQDSQPMHCKHVVLLYIHILQNLNLSFFYAIIDLKCSKLKCNCNCKCNVIKINWFTQSMCLYIKFHTFHT